MGLFMGFTVKRLCEKWLYEWLQQIFFLVELLASTDLEDHGRSSISSSALKKTFAMLSCECRQWHAVRQLRAKESGATSVGCSVRLSGCGIEVILVGRVWRTLGASIGISMNIPVFGELFEDHQIISCFDDFGDEVVIPIQWCPSALTMYTWVCLKIGIPQIAISMGKVMIDHQSLGYHIFRQPPHGSCNL